MESCYSTSRSNVSRVLHGGFVHRRALLDRSGRLAALLNTIARTGTVLGLFTAETPEWGGTEVATILGLPKSTTFDLLTSLAEIGLLQQTSDDRYRLGWQLLVIRRRLINSMGFNDQTQRTIAELAHHLNAAVTIGAWDGRGVVCIAHASASRSGPVLAEGARLPGHASALGKLLMAQRPWPKLQERIQQYGLPALTVNSVSDIDVFRKQLTCARDNDLAVEHGETVLGQSCLAVGIYDREHRVIAALSICTPSETMHARHAEFARIARRAAYTLSARIVKNAPATYCGDGGHVDEAGTVVDARRPGEHRREGGVIWHRRCIEKRCPCGDRQDASDLQAGSA
jgi:DNA-binding IclR family transcriptional regulator